MFSHYGSVSIPSGFRRLSRLLGGVLVLSLVTEAGWTQENDLARELPRLPPVVAGDAGETFEIQHGFQLRLVASEPLVGDPVDACFDASGRLIVAEMHGYPYSFEKRPQQPEGGGKKDAGLIRVLEDTDGDGVFDRSVVMVDRISWPTSVCCYDGGVFVIAPPHLYYFKDTDGDLIADVRETVLSGFSRHNVQALANGLKWGLDNHIYFAAGRNGGTLTRDGRELMQLGPHDLRLNPRTREFEVVTGGLQFGHSFDDWGNRFVCSNSNHILHVAWPREAVERNPSLTVGSQVRSAAVEGGAAPVFRRSPAEPWRIVRTRRRAADPNMSKRLPATELVPVGFFTSATGVTVYRGDAYGDEFRGNVFIGDVGGNLIHRKTLTRNGISFAARRADERVEFVASTDTWFRPTNFVNAPDGALYVLDMYRETIEHPVSIPEDIKAFLDLESGHDRGRIYRLESPGMVRRAISSLAALSNPQLVELLTHANGWHRETAQRLLVERQAADQIGSIRMLLQHANPLARVHALWTLAGLGQLETQDLVKALQDPDARVIRQAAIAVRRHPLAIGSADLDLALNAAAAHADVPVRFEVAITLGAVQSPESIKTLAQLFDRAGENADLRLAVLSSSHGRLTELAERLLDDQPGSQTATLIQLCEVLGTSAASEPVERIVGRVVAGEELLQKSRLLSALAAGLAQRGQTLDQIMQRETATESARNQLAGLSAEARTIARDGNASESLRIAAVRWLAWDRDTASRQTLIELIDPTVEPQIQLEAVESLGKRREAEIAGDLISVWSTSSPTVRRKVLTALLDEISRTMRLLDAIADGAIKTGEMPRETRQALQQHASIEVRKRAGEVLKEQIDVNRQAVIDAYRSAAAKDGIVDNGRQLFAKNCATCHRAESQGHLVGPEMASVANKSREDLLIAILDPNRESQPNYHIYNALTTQGKVVSGILVSETPSAIVLRQADARETTVFRETIETLQATGVSLMPVGLEKQLTPEQMADLLSYVQSLKKAAE